MTARILLVRSFFPLLLLAPLAVASQAAAADTRDASLVKRVLAAELQNAQDAQHPMRYVLRKSSPRLSSTKEIIETRDGAVARLLAINGKPLSAADEQKATPAVSGIASRARTTTRHGP
jgi:hypothetical protein